MAEKTSTPPRSKQEQSAELNAISWTFSSGSPEKIQEVLERLLWTPVPRIQQIGLNHLIKMSKSSPHASPEMEQIFDTISKRVGMFSVFASGTHEAMSSLTRGLSVLGGKRLDTFGILEFLSVAQANDDVSYDIIEELEGLAKKVLIYYWKIFSRDDIDEMQRLLRRLKQASPKFLNIIKIWSLFDAAQKNPHAPQAIKKNLDALRNREKATREKKGSAEAEKRAQDDFNSMLLKKPKSRRSEAMYRSLQGPNKQALQEEFDKLEKAISDFEKQAQKTQSLIPESASAISNCCDKVKEEQKQKFAARITTFCENYTNLHGNQVVTSQKEQVKELIIKFSTQMASINGINIFTKLIAQLDEYNHKKTTNESNEKRKAEIERFLF